ncbi:uncharacterized protein LOC113444045 [Pseudonaja textilis]|uniref:uncharacterized protein LOC113444045 n=1 Tax=Pseudonaja textilis TaxID=8673 RepID=UPI000EAA7CAB|nr:uncharacterized protein LOC113444045 [Pseudonaja textilis]
MSDCSAHKGGEMQERRKEDESYTDNGNFPELRCGARKHTEDQTDEKCGEPGSSEGLPWQPEESDSIPSIFLAAFLAFVFVSVSMVLLCHKTVHFSLRDPNTLSPNSVHLPKEDVQSLPLFFPNQPESTWGTFLRYVCNPLGKSHLEEPWILVGIGPGDTSRTLLCFTKIMLSLLTQQKSIHIEFLDPTSPWLPPMGSSKNRTWVISSVKVLWGQESLPGGLVVSLQSILDRKGEATKKAFALVGNGGEQSREGSLLQRLTPSLISRILSLNPNRRLSKVMIDHENFLLLFVTSEQYLESECPQIFQ